MNEQKELPNRQLVKNRISVVERLYYQDHINRESPVDYGNKFSVNLESDEQPYQRTNVIANTEWKRLDFGWLSSPGLFEITNNDKVAGLEIAYAAMPSEGSVVPLESLVAINEIYPLASTRNALAANVDVYIRSQSGTVKYSLVAFPK